MGKGGQSGGGPHAAGSGGPQIRGGGEKKGVRRGGREEEKGEGNFVRCGPLYIMKFLTNFHMKKA